MSHTASVPRDDREKRRQDEKHLKILQELLKEPENLNCADCGQRGPRWASANIGCFLCIRCGGLHRKLGTHISKIKSITLDSWTPEQIQVMQQMGNKRVNEKYLGNASVAPPSVSDADLETFIRNKYERSVSMNGGGVNRGHAQSSNKHHASHYNDDNGDAQRLGAHLQALASMGFTDRERATAALKATDGQLGLAAELLVTSRPSISANRAGSSSQSPAQSQKSLAAYSTGNGRRSTIDSLICGALEQLSTLGFDDEELCLQALRRANGNVEQAANMLLDYKRHRSSSAGVPAQQQQQQQQAHNNSTVNSNIFAQRGQQQQHQAQQKGGADGGSFLVEPPGQNVRRGSRAQQQLAHPSGNQGQIQPQQTNSSGALLDLLGLDQPPSNPYQQQQQQAQQQYAMQQQQEQQQMMQQQRLAMRQQLAIRQQPLQQASPQSKGNVKDGILSLYGSNTNDQNMNGAMVQAGPNGYNPFAAQGQLLPSPINGAQAPQQPAFGLPPRQAQVAPQHLSSGSNTQSQAHMFAQQIITQQPQQQVPVRSFADTMQASHINGASFGGSQARLLQPFNQFVQVPAQPQQGFGGQNIPQQPQMPFAAQPQQEGGSCVGANGATTQQPFNQFGAAHAHQAASATQYNGQSYVTYAPAFNSFGANGITQNNQQVPRAAMNVAAGGHDRMTQGAQQGQGSSSVSVFAPLVNGSLNPAVAQQGALQQKFSFDASKRPGANIPGYNGNPFTL
ncbi:hypothetical protein SeMB42_g07962 [Synchytrium endobioticum]|uniref:Arf-GAP domain-containing protein n=1 Tax=Synchytrium endobioticum TaxID=286115 RepID=A0A507BWF7_9FUNG|nr:hypothetical protein SeMB42_g07962 [Synchytrium endobioticum]TPX42833.1 hypothetical protein SeLEV6574_g05385 [Synchytrium endobioticum]